MNNVRTNRSRAARPSFLWGAIPADKWMRDLQAKSRETYEHSVRVSLLAERFGARLKLPPETARLLMRGCFLHDLGKLLLPKRLLSQTEPYTPRQRRIVKLHPELGAEILEMDKGIDPEVLDIVRFHHERWDGTGYPQGRGGDRIPALARICAVIEAFDGMASGHAGRPRLSYEEARRELLREAGSRFDERIVRAFVGFLDEEFLRQTPY